MDSFKVFWLRGNLRYVVTHFFFLGAQSDPFVPEFSAYKHGGS